DAIAPALRKIMVEFAVEQCDQNGRKNNNERNARIGLEMAGFVQPPQQVTRARTAILSYQNALSGIEPWMREVDAFCTFARDRHIGDGDIDRPGSRRFDQLPDVFIFDVTAGNPNLAGRKLP